MRRTSCLSLLVLAASSASCADWPSVAEREEPILGGSLDSGHPAVVLLAGGGWRCTGTVITPWIVLTAAHCLTDMAPIQVYFGPNMTESTKVLRATNKAKHPLWKESTFAHDVGIVILDEPSPIEPMPYSMADLSSSAGTRMTIVGFGLQSEAAGSVSGQKLQVHVVVDQVTTHALRYNDAAVCSGDSGGPGFFEIGGRETVVAVTSFGDSMCQSFGGSQRMDVEREWLTQEIAANDRTTCFQDFRCATGCLSADPDCPCSSTDGFCDALCHDPESDANCPRGCGGGGSCVRGPSCPAPDPDCGDPCGGEGHCLRDCATRDPDCPVPLADGGRCSDDFDCAGASICVGIAGERTCTRKCDPVAANSCPGGTTCLALAPGKAVCQGSAEGEGGGCSVGGGAGPSGAAFALLGCLVTALRRRRLRPRRASTGR